MALSIRHSIVEVTQHIAAIRAETPSFMPIHSDANLAKPLYLRISILVMIRPFFLIVANDIPSAL